MADTYIRGLILADIVTRAAGITVAGGYVNNIGTIHRLPVAPSGDDLEQLFGQATKPMLAVTDGDPETNEDETGHRTIRRLRPHLLAYVSSTATVASQRINDMIGDLEKFIAANRTAWHAAVVDTKVEAVAIIQELERPHAGCDLSLLISVERGADSP